MQLFKTVDQKIEDLGFKKIDDNQYIVLYERDFRMYADNTQHGYRQVVSICHKRSGRHIIQSYDPDLFDSKNIGNTCVGLTYKEMKLFMKKMKKKGWVTHGKCK